MIEQPFFLLIFIHMEVDFIFMFVMWKYFTTIKISRANMSVRQVSKIFDDEISASCNIPEGNNVLGENNAQYFSFYSWFVPLFCYACYTLSRVNWICLFQRLCYQKLFSIIVRSDVTTYICCMGIFQSDIEKIDNE